jgi:hypothetical protein
MNLKIFQMSLFTILLRKKSLEKSIQKLILRSPELEQPHFGNCIFLGFTQLLFHSNLLLKTIKKPMHTILKKNFEVIF